ncbi:hypothetical protein ACQP2P_19085 [Dactylosporangium sp. CA-139114]|uniref:hypothetical protein n=1 Tax=Dactylosporangium sp. CA-139114 TaxID=3239931 RepID=UPI003D985417
MPDVLANARAEALFVSSVQSSESPAAVEVRKAVAESFARLGSRGCAACVAGEFGDHPEVAVARMRWAIAMVSTVYRPTRRPVCGRPHRPRPTTACTG